MSRGIWAVFGIVDRPIPISLALLLSRSSLMICGQRTKYGRHAACRNPVAVVAAASAAGWDSRLPGPAPDLLTCGLADRSSRGQLFFLLLIRLSSPSYTSKEGQKLGYLETDIKFQI